MLAGLDKSAKGTTNKAQLAESRIVATHTQKLKARVQAILDFPVPNGTLALDLLVFLDHSFVRLTFYTI